MRLLLAVLAVALASVQPATGQPLADPPADAFTVSLVSGLSTYRAPGSGYTFQFVGNNGSDERQLNPTPVGKGTILTYPVGLRVRVPLRPRIAGEAGLSALVDRGRQTFGLAFAEAGLVLSGFEDRQGPLGSNLFVSAGGGLTAVYTGDYEGPGLVTPITAQDADGEPIRYGVYRPHVFAGAGLSKLVTERVEVRAGARGRLAPVTSIGAVAGLDATLSVGYRF